MYKCATKSLNHHKQVSHCHLPWTPQRNIWSPSYRRTCLFKSRSNTSTYLELSTIAVIVSHSAHRSPRSKLCWFGGCHGCPSGKGVVLPPKAWNTLKSLAPAPAKAVFPFALPKACAVCSLLPCSSLECPLEAEQGFCCVQPKDDTVQPTITYVSGKHEFSPGDSAKSTLGGCVDDVIRGGAIVYVRVYECVCLCVCLYIIYRCVYVGTCVYMCICVCFVCRCMFVGGRFCIFKLKSPKKAKN